MGWRRFLRVQNQLYLRTVLFAFLLHSQVYGQGTPSQDAPTSAHVRSNLQILRRNCNSLIASLIPELVQDSSQDTRIYASNQQDMANMLSSAGVSPNDIQSIMETLGRATGPLGESISLEAMVAMFQSRFDDNFLLCVLGRGCRLPNGRAQLSMEANQGFFRIGDISSPNNAVPGTSRPAGLQSMVVMPHPYNNFSAADWVSILVHEYIHYRDLWTIRHWMSRNTNRVSHGLSPDPLFQRFVRFQNGEYVVSNAFWLAYTESRAYYASWRTALRLEIPGESSTQQFHRARGYKAIRSRLGQQALNTLGITEENFFNFWRRMDQQMFQFNNERE